MAEHTIDYDEGYDPDEDLHDDDSDDEDDDCDCWYVCLCCGNESDDDGDNCDVCTGFCWDAIDY